jgi:anti-sigma factor ChrR (cupin superfamily)
MSSRNDVFAPVGWEELATSGTDPGVFIKTLRDPRGDGQTLQVVRYAPGASQPVAAEGSAQMLVLEGCLEEAAVDAHGRESTAVCQRGDFVDYPPGTRTVRTSAGGCLVLVDTHAPGADGAAAERVQRVADCFGPRGWTLSPDVATGSGGKIEGVWMKPLRLAGPRRSLLLIYFEPGSVYPAHVHTEPEQLLILSGAAEDKIFEHGGDLREVTYRRGAFVDYPVPLFHATHCPRGCMLLFAM